MSIGHQHEFVDDKGIVSRCPRGAKKGVQVKAIRCIKRCKYNRGYFASVRYDTYSGTQVKKVLNIICACPHLLELRRSVERWDIWLKGRNLNK